MSLQVDVVELIKKNQLAKQTTILKITKALTCKNFGQFQGEVGPVLVVFACFKVCYRRDVCVYQKGVVFIASKHFS